MTEDLNHYSKEERTIDIMKAQLYAILYFIPFALLFGIPYFIFWRSQFTVHYLTNRGLLLLPIILLVVVAGIVLHELIHGITWSLFAKTGFRSIKFGVMWKALTPYCHCKEPLLVKQYIIGAIMPAVILGFLPSIIGIMTGNFGLFIFGMFFTMAAGGDFMIIHLLSKESMNSMVQDHPDKVGCYIYKPK